MLKTGKITVGLAEINGSLLLALRLASQYNTIQYNKKESSSAQSYIKQGDCALQTSTYRLRAKNNVKKMSFECSLECSESTCLDEAGRLFQPHEPKTEKACLPNWLNFLVD